MARIVVTGYMIRHPFAGNMLAYFHYLLGFHRLGHEVCYLEESGWPDSCYNPATRAYGDDPSCGMRAVRSLMSSYDIDLPVYFVNRASGAITATGNLDLDRLLASADLLVNLGGVCSLPEFGLSPRRVLVDMDPLFTQAGRFAGDDLANYDVYFSYGLNVGRAQCSVPDCGLDWLPTLPPVVPELWRVPPGQADSAQAGAPFTTLCNWNAYGAITYQGEHYGQKDEEFQRVINLPGHCSRQLELAVSGADGETSRRFMAAGWSIRDAAELSTTLPAYQAYIQGSRGEFSVAKHAYVKTRSGWFSDRSVCYLAAGRPVVVQDTGIGDQLPTGQGILVFSSLDQAAECLARVDTDYAAHSRAATELAEQLFSYRVVLPGLLERGLAGRPSNPRGGR